MGVHQGLVLPGPRYIDWEGAVCQMLPEFSSAIQCWPSMGACWLVGYATLIPKLNNCMLISSYSVSLREHL